MQVRSGLEAILMLASSDRVREDLAKLLAFDAKLFHMSVVLREWMDDVPLHPEGEFRLVVPFMRQVLCEPGSVECCHPVFYTGLLQPCTTST